MDTRRPGLIARFFGLLRGGFAGWLRHREEQSPGAVYENAIGERVEQYRELKEAVAGILYMRNKLGAEIDDRRVELARTLEDLRRAVSRDDDELGIALVTRKQSLVDELEHAERELESLRLEAEEAKTNLVRFREEIRALEREKGRTLASLANARARRRIQETLSGLSVDADMRALEVVREKVARMTGEAVLDRELGAAHDIDGRLRALREESRRESAVQELAELKRRVAARTLGTGEPVAEIPVAEPARVAEPALAQAS
jgi:phage shock protein A